jgi:hypothetical protein
VEAQAKTVMRTLKDRKENGLKTVREYLASRHDIYVPSNKVRYFKQAMKEALEKNV